MHKDQILLFSSFIFSLLSFILVIGILLNLPIKPTTNETASVTPSVAVSVAPSLEPTATPSAVINQRKFTPTKPVVNPSR